MIRNNISFGAKLISNYTTFDKNKKSVTINMYQLEPRDSDYIDKFVSSIDEYSEDNLSYEELSKNNVMKEALLDTLDLLEKQKDKTSKIYKNAVVYMAFCKGKPQGMLMANSPKMDIKNGSIHYSPRKNHGNCETELDWLVNWSEGIKGIGKALVAEFFLSLKNTNFKQVYLRSVLPENSFAFEFYNSLGFKQIGNRDLNHKYSNYVDLVHGKYEDSGCLDEIIPMVIRKKKINQTSERLIKDMNRTKRPKDFISVNLD